MKDESDRLAKHLAQVFSQPTKLLEGPNCVHKAAQKHFVIVGAGMAGLTSAYLLLKAGHSVKINFLFELRTAIHAIDILSV